MDHLSISESILQSLEARERRRGAKQERKEDAPARGPSSEEALLASCAKELERTVRDSVRTAFAHWEVGLVREVEGIARRVSRSREAGTTYEPVAEAPARQLSSAKTAVFPAASHSQEMSAARVETVVLPEPPASRPASRRSAGPQGEESWDDLVEAVKELRREWDQETFEKCFGDDSAPAPAAAPAQAAAESAPPPSRREPAPQSREREALTFREKSEGRGGQGGHGGPAEPVQREALGRKLDELIHLVKTSLPPGTKAPTVPREVSSEIAREVVGRLKDTLATISRGSAAPGQKAGPPPPEARIPMDDIGAIIDSITGPGRS